MCGIPFFILVIDTVRTSHTQSRGSVVVYQVCDGMTASMLFLHFTLLYNVLSNALGKVKHYRPHRQYVYHQEAL